MTDPVSARGTKTKTRKKPVRITRRLTKGDDDVSGEVGNVRQEDERAPDADDADEAEDRDADEERKGDLAGAVRPAQSAPVLIEHGRDVDWRRSCR